MNCVTVWTRDEPQYDADVSVGEILRPKKLLPRLGSKTLAVLRTVADNPCGISLNGPAVHLNQILSAIRDIGRVRNNKDVVPYLVLRTVADNPCGISLNGPAVHLNQILSAIRDIGRVRNNKDVVPYLTLACASIHCVGGGGMSDVPDCERWTAKVCRDLPAVAKLLDPTILFLLTGPGVALPAFKFEKLPVGPNNMQISSMPQQLVAPVGATGHAGGGVAVRMDNVYVLNAARDIGLISATIRRQAPLVCLARLSTNSNFICCVQTSELSPVSFQ